MTTVFLQETSYEPAPEPLPFDILPNDDLVLLTVHLSSLGQVSVHRSTSVKNVDAGSNRRTGKKNIPVLLFSEDIYAP